MSDTDPRARSRDHGSEEDWVDLARGLAEPERQARLEQHLETACPRCAKTHRLWVSVVEAAQQEDRYRPPDGVLRQLAGEFALGRSREVRQRPVLVFDSLRQRPAFGVRSLAQGARQLLYSAGRYRIRVQIEGGKDAPGLAIVGQILDADDPGSHLKDVAVLARTRGRTLDRTLTNHLGEFVLEAEAATDLKLRVGATEIGIATGEARTGDARPKSRRRLDDRRNR